MKTFITLLTLLCTFPDSNFFAQNAAVPVRQADFTYTAEGNGIRFEPVMPPLMQKAGARPAYYSYLWEFGDGSFSRQENPLHIYAANGDFEVLLSATAHYDDGEKPRGKKKKVPVNRPAGAFASTDTSDVFEETGVQAIAMGAECEPRATERIVFIVSYRNNGLVTTGGRLHLFFNEKVFPTSHFSLDTARTHHGESPDQSYTQSLPAGRPPGSDWAALFWPPASTGLNAASSADIPPFGIAEDMLNTARGLYREEKAWQFSELQPGEKRNFFVSLDCTENMLKDTSAFIHLEAVFAPFDPVVAPERFVIEIEIVSSHDPNAIAVSDNRVNYRTVGNKKLDYKVRFQNNGEGPAGTVEVKIEVPKGLDMARMRPLDWYPKCPVCPKTPTNRSCLDTASSKSSLTFTFRNIYLPGSRQEGVDDLDSTKGFVKYRIEAGKNMPKLPFRSRAKIIFDKNAPILTNFTKTRFKVGISPGLKVGYNYDPDFKDERYFFLGASLSPYKSWRIYPQVELLTGIKGKDEFEFPAHRDSSVIEYFVMADSNLKDTIRFVYGIKDSVVSGNTGFFSFEIPVLLRKNFSKFFGAGIGGSARVIFENGEYTETVRKRIYNKSYHFMPGTPQADLLRDTSYTRTYDRTATRTRFTAFADLTFGSVRAGPNLGIRAGAVLNRRKLLPFVQVSLELKL